MEREWKGEVLSVFRLESERPIIKNSSVLACLHSICIEQVLSLVSITSIINMKKMFVVLGFLLGISACNFNTDYYDSPLSPEVVDKLIFINEELENSFTLRGYLNGQAHTDFKKRMYQLVNDKDFLPNIKKLKT
jgi:hypothetical protein